MQYICEMYSIGILFVPIFCRLVCFLYLFINLQHLSKITVFTLKNLYSRYQFPLVPLVYMRLMENMFNYCDIEM